MKGYFFYLCDQLATASLTETSFTSEGIYGIKKKKHNGMYKYKYTSVYCTPASHNYDWM